MSTAALARQYVDAILRCYATARDSDEREKIAAEIARLWNGGVRDDLADMTSRALRQTREE
jgi:hypothetical protein